MFEEELCTYNQYLLSLALGLCKSKSQANDLVQDTMVRALRHQDKFEPGTNMKAWLSRIMKNLFYNQWRRSIRGSEILEQVKQEYQPEEISHQAFSKLEVEAILKLLKAKMSPDFFAVLFYCDHKDFAYKEAAELLDIPLGTVMSRLYRGRRQAREILRKSYNNELLELALC